MKLTEEVEEFLIESKEYLESAEPVLIELRGIDDVPRDKVDLLFRIFHSIKGVSGFLDFTLIQSLTHRLEEVLDQVRQDKLIINEAILDIMLDGFDVIRNMLVAIEETGEENQGLKDRVDSLINSIEGLMESSSTGGRPGGVEFESGSFFSCFQSDEFIKNFEIDFENHVKFIEEQLFELLDDPSKMSEIMMISGEHVARLFYNVKILGLNNIEKALNSFQKAQVTFASGLEFDSSVHLGQLFGLLNWAKDNLFESEDNLDELEALCEAVENLNSADTASSEGKTLDIDAEEVEKQAEVAEKVVKKSRGDVRVEMEKVDKLVEFIEELGVVAGVVSAKSDYMTEDNAFIQASNKLKQITASLQDVAMSVRLTPLTGTFKKMNRVVYDVSKKLGRKVQLLTKGEKTELDRNMVEALQDPLVHIFRNAIDHGIEDPDVRVAAGKEDLGTIELDAWFSGGDVVISIKDDGNGMDAQKIFEKALQKGVVGEEFNSKSDSEKLNLIFAPGFSTNAAVTDFSGRGVGMDVVKQSIEGLGGEINIESTLGSGSTFLLNIPITSTIVQSLLVRAVDVVYSLRVSMIKELFKLDNRSLFKSPDGRENVRLRNEVYPVVRLSRLRNELSVESDENSGEPIEQTMILMENKGSCVALIVDEILGSNHGVIKMLPELLKNTEGVSGCSVIGTNSEDVSWTLDINALMRMEKEGVL